MRVLGFKAKNFRNIEECDIVFSHGVNLLVGNNAEGKTNCLEGIYMFSRGKSFRGAEDKFLIKNGEEGFYLSLDYEDKKGKENLEYSLLGRTRQRKKNGYKLKSVGEMIGSFHSVLFEPDNLGLVKEGPDLRRAFLNVAISQINPEYIRIYSDFKTSLENRNAILKNASKGLYYDEKELFEWSVRVAEYSSYIYLERKKYIEKLRVFAEERMREFSSGKETLTLGYKNNIEESKTREDVRKEYIKILSENTEKEVRAATSLYGPQREDIEIYINGKEAKVYASQGQQRSIVLSMKLAEGEVLREVYGEEPVYLFDDVLSELDKDRRRYLIEGMKNRQIIITSCESDELIERADRVIKVENGRFCDVSSHR